MTMMLKAKVKVAQDLKKEFNEILKLNQDTFSKSMLSDLKKIVTKANKDHFLEMKQEQEIIHNLPQSEEWFLYTYERLKKIAGKSLNQVDFKEFTQLSTVIHEQKEVEQLIKTKMPADQLIGAALNLWKSLSGVKWLSELRKLIQQSESSQIEMEKVKDLHQRAQIIGINYEKEISKQNIFERYFSQFSKIVDSIQKFESKFGDKRKLVKTLEDIYEENFLRYYKSIDDQYKNKIPLDQVMLLSQQATDKELPDEMNIKQFLTQRKNRFMKFTREYDDYKRFRENIRQRGQAGNDNNRFTCKFIRKLIEECKSLSIEKDHAYNYDESILEDDILAFEEWKLQAKDLITTIQQDELSLNDQVLRKQFMILQKQMKQLPIYDKELFIKVQGFDWLYSCLDMLEIKKDEESLSIGTWESLIKQSDSYLSAFPDLKSHPIFQRILWEIEQSRQVIEFVNLQKNNQKAWAAKYNLDKQQNYAFFRNKNPKNKLQKILDIANQSKVDVTEEIRCLDMWIRDYEKYFQLHKENKLSKDMNFEKLRDVCKLMYLSPIDYGEIYFSIKDKIDTAEMIRLNLKKVFQEHEALVQSKQKDDERPKRLRYSRISFDLKLFKKSCNISGIKEVELAQEKVKLSQEKISEIRNIISQIDYTDIQSNFQQIKQKLDQAKKIFTEIEIDMEDQELEAKRLIFEADLRLIFSNLGKNKRNLHYEEFKDLDKIYDKLKNTLKDDSLHSKFLAIKNQVSDIVRKINKLENKDDLERIQREAEKECPSIDFTQLLTDKDAQIQLGKRKNRDQITQNTVIIDEEESFDLALTSKRQKKSQQSSQGSLAGISDSEQKSKNSSSGDESGSSSSSGSGSSDSDSGSNSGSESDSSSDESEGDQQNIAKNRSRRNIVPNIDSDFIYATPLVNAVKKMQFERKAKQLQENEESKESITSEDRKKQLDEKRQRKLRRKQKREQQRIEEKKKQKMKQQLNEYRLQQNKSQGTIQHRAKLQGKFDPDQPISFQTQVAHDKGLQDSLQTIKNKIREQSRMKLKEAIENSSPAFSKLDNEKKKAIIVDLETEMFNKHPEVDHYYRKKAADACENIKYLSAFKEIAELIAVKRSIQLNRLLQPHHQFRDNIQKIDQGLKEKRFQLKQLQRQLIQKQQKEEEELKEQESELQVPNEQQMMKVLYSNNQTNILTEELKESYDIQQRVKVSDSDDDLQSLDSNPALFSDDEDNILPPQQNQYDTYQNKTLIQNQYVINQYQGEYRNLGQQIIQPGLQQRQIQLYNPFEIIEQKYSRFNQKKSVEPIMYDPIKDRNLAKGSLSKEKNLAPPGSLLKVWEGMIEISKDQQPLVQFFSTQDIQVFQALPSLPHNLTLKGKSNISDVTSHFLRLRKEKRLVKGWITRRGNVGSFNQGNLQSTSNWQENSDKYTKLFDELESTNRAALFNVFQGVTFYLVPITAKTKDFCKQMGILPESIHQHDKSLLSNSLLDIESSIQDETHCYAVLSQIKQTFNTKLNFLNPDVLRMAEISSQELAQVKDKLEQQNKPDMSYSPITSDEEGNPKAQHKTQILQSVKTEDISQQQARTEPQKLLIKQDEQATTQMREQQMVAIKKSEEDDDDIDIDDLIMKFKKQEYDIQSIQAKLIPIIHKVRGEKEIKLTKFLEELIQSYNNPQPQQIQPQVKQENVQMMQTQNPAFNQGMYQQQNFGQQNIPQYGMQNQPQRFPMQSQMPPQGQFMNQPQMSGQFRQIPPQQQFQGQMPQQQIRPQNQPHIGAVYPTQQMPQMNMQLQQANQQFQQRQGGNNPMQQQQPIFQQSNIGIPPLRPPPSSVPMQQAQMVRPGVQGMMPPQQPFGGNIPPRLMGGPQTQQFQQQIRQQPPNQQQRK